MDDFAVEIKASAADGSCPPVESSVRDIVRKSAIKDERLAFARIPRPIGCLERLLPGLVRLGHPVLIDQQAHEWNGVRQLDGQTKLELSIPNRESRIR